VLLREAAAVEEVVRAAAWWRSRPDGESPGGDQAAAEAAAAAADVMQRRRPAASAAAAAARARALRGLAQLVASVGGYDAADDDAALQAVHTALGAAPAPVAGLTHTPTGGWMAREMMAELRRAHAAAAAITAAAAGTEQVAADEAAEAAAAEGATASSGSAQAPPWQQLAAATAALAARVEEEKPLPSVDIGKLTGARGARVPTTPTPPGYRDHLANRDGPLGCYYVMPTGQGGQPDDAYRLPVIEAEEMALASIAEGGGRAAEGELRRVAREGRGGEGWPILGRPQPVTLPVSTLGLRNDPVGAAKWARMWQLAEEVASGVGVRLLCHCRWTRATGARECKPCHCEVLAPIIEQMVTARRAEKVKAAAWAAAEDISIAAAVWRWKRRCGLSGNRRGWDSTGGRCEARRASARKRRAPQTAAGRVSGTGGQARAAIVAAQARAAAQARWKR
jgi:hypothetical protein